MTEFDYQELRNRLEPLDDELAEYLEGNQLRHPLIVGIVNDRARAAQTNHWYRGKREACLKALETRDWHGFICIHERPYRLEKFYYISNECTDEEYWESLAFVWMDSENTWRNMEIWKELWNCERPDKAMSMTLHEREVLAAMPAELTIYRGFREERLEGISWTMDYDVAVRFARRFRGTGSVATARASKTDVHAFFDERQEREVVIDNYIVVEKVALSSSE